MKTQSLFTPGQSVRTVISEGTVANVSQFPDHTEYLVEFHDGTAAWIHESQLTAVAASRKSAANLEKPAKPTINEPSTLN